MSTDFASALDAEIAALEADIARDPRSIKLAELRRIRGLYISQFDGGDHAYAPAAHAAAHAPAAHAPATHAPAPHAPAVAAVPPAAPAAPRPFAAEFERKVIDRPRGL